MAQTPAAPNQSPPTEAEAIRQIEQHIARSLSELMGRARKLPDTLTKEQYQEGHDGYYEEGGERFYRTTTKEGITHEAYYLGIVDDETPMRQGETQPSEGHIPTPTFRLSSSKPDGPKTVISKRRSSDHMMVHDKM